MNRGSSAGVMTDPRKAWPGKKYVDIVGVDTYDGWPAVLGRTGWNKQYKGAYGLKFWAEFARTKGKRLSVPEWGLYRGSNWAGHNGGDNPYYIKKMFGFFREQRGNLAYEAYFNDEIPEHLTALSVNPKARPSTGGRSRSRWRPDPVRPLCPPCHPSPPRAMTRVPPRPASSSRTRSFSRYGRWEPGRARPGGGQGRVIDQPGHSTWVVCRERSPRARGRWCDQKLSTGCARRNPECRSCPIASASPRDDGVEEEKARGDP